MSGFRSKKGEGVGKTWATNLYAKKTQGTNPWLFRDSVHELRNRAYWDLGGGRENKKNSSTPTLSRGSFHKSHYVTRVGRGGVGGCAWEVWGNPLPYHPWRNRQKGGRGGGGDLGGLHYPLEWEEKRGVDSGATFGWGGPEKRHPDFLFIRRAQVAPQTAFLWAHGQFMGRKIKDINKERKKGVGGKNMPAEITENFRSYLDRAESKGAL